MAKPKRLSPEAIEVLATMEVTGNEARITAGALDRKLYTEVNAALDAFGGKWNRKAKAHVFEGNPQDAIEQVSIDGAFTDEKREFEYFATPPEVAKQLVDCLELQPGDKVLEPSCGEGSLIEALLAKCPEVDIQAYDIRPDAVEKVYFKTFKEPDVAVAQRDFMGKEPKPQYKFVVMNPPFSRQQDIDHILHAHKFLIPGGKLVAIASAGVVFRTNRKTVEFREFVEDYSGTIRKLPVGSFKSSGTNVSTVIVEIPA